MKKALTLVALLAVIMLPYHAVAQDCEEDLEACIQVLDESSDTIAVIEGYLTECLDSQANEGEASIGDLFDLIPAYRRLPRGLKFAITSIVTLGIGVGIMYIPPPEGL